MKAPYDTQTAEVIQRLSLMCELDRLRLRLALRPAPSDELTIGGLPKSAITKAFSFMQFVPGRIGKIARGLAIGSTFFRFIRPLMGTLRNNTRNSNKGIDSIRNATSYRQGPRNSSA